MEQNQERKLVDGVLLERGLHMQHAEYGQIEVDYSIDRGWHYLRWGFAGFGTDFDNVTQLATHRNADKCNQLKAEDYVRIETGCSEGDQMGSFQNGTLQGFGERLAVTIQTHLALPPEMESMHQEEAVAYLRSLLSKASAAVENKLVFDVQIGPSAGFENEVDVSPQKMRKPRSGASLGM